MCHQGTLHSKLSLKNCVDSLLRLAIDWRCRPVITRNPEVIMFNSSLIAKKIAHGFVIALIAALALAATAAAQTQDPAERQRAIDVYESQNMVAALPLLEKVAVAYPNDPIVLSRL